MHPAPRVRTRLARNADVVALGIPLPAVERALDGLTLDVAAVAQVRAEVF